MDNPIRQDRHRWRRWALLLGLILIILVASGLGVARLMQTSASIVTRPSGTNVDDNEQLVPNRLSDSGSCGVERWPVKTGTDPDAPQVNLNSKTHTSVKALGSLPAPHNLPQDHRVPHSAEFIQWILTATLVQFRLESDSDYHLILHDSQGNTMITEIPDPTCIMGKSPFASGITLSRNEFNAKYHVITSWQYVNIPVQVIGIGFFDYFHGQDGIAPNAIELHPVMDIQFNPKPTPTPSPSPSPSPTPSPSPSPSPSPTPTPSPSPSPSPSPTGTPIGGNLIVDGGFEYDSPAWVLGGTYPPSRSTSQAHSGQYSMKVGITSGQQGNAQTYQLVNIPTNITSATLTFWYWPATNDSSQYGWQEADVVDSNDHILQRLFRSTTNDQTWKELTFDLSSYAGQTIGIQFLDHELSNGYAYYTYMYVDDVSLTVS